jgi:hypothetical protein
MFLGVQLPIIAPIGQGNHQTVARRKRMGICNTPQNSRQWLRLILTNFNESVLC